jgi:hypothetical protein
MTSVFPMIIFDTTELNINMKNKSCAGGIATGNVVKNGRSIFWKNRHMTGENNKPYFYQGPVYKYFGIGETGGTFMGMNEAGLAVGNFAIDEILDNWNYISDGTYGQTSQIMNYLLGNFATVSEAAMFSALHMNGCSQLGIISSEPGIGAVVSVGKNPNGQIATNITWCNNTAIGLANAFYCDGNNDYDNNDITIQTMFDDILTHGGINGDFKIDWEEVCQRGGKNVSGKEWNFGTFTSSREITNPYCVSGFVSVSGDPTFDGSLNIAWLAMGRQPLVGLWLPLSASYLTNSNDIPSEYRIGGGIEDYVDQKVSYATGEEGQGNYNYYCERVLEIQDYTNSNEKYMFNEYDKIIDTIPINATSSEVKSLIGNYVTDIVPTLISAYVSETVINNNPPSTPDDPLGPTSGKSGNVYTFSTKAIDPDGNHLYYKWDWDDGTTSKWLGPYKNGIKITESHIWVNRGDYNVRVKVKDKWGGESNWSNPIHITIPKNKSFNNLNPWILILIEQFPILERLLYFFQLII